MAELIRGLDAARVRARYEEVRAEVGDGVEVLAAVKYVAPEELGVLVEAGITVVGENRQQALAEKQPLAPELTWDFIGQLQSRKVKDLVGHVRWIHSVASDSALKELRKHGTTETEVLVEVNVAREQGKGGVLPDELDAFLERGAGGPFSIVGLMTMPPLAARSEDNRRWFAALAELAGERDLPQLSMGTTQDYAVAAQEGATVVRIGTRLYR